ncbi:MAG: Fic family protein [Patescibacteria group bacterium]
MIEITPNQQEILWLFMQKDSSSSSVIHSELVEQEKNLSLVTVKRELSALKLLGLLEIHGAGRAVEYSINTYGRLLTKVDAKAYSAIEPDKRHGLKSYNFSLFDSIPTEIFTPEELITLEKATVIYRARGQGLSPTLKEKELERFIIELSWKSSKIEGNTYTLLDTERLIMRGEEAPGHDKKEARMILNHKDAFKFVRDQAKAFRNLNRAHIEEVHKILVKGMDVQSGPRAKAVGITGSIYQPLDNSHQITEALEKLIGTVNRLETPYAKALIALLGLSYIQPFEDGNKRTSRLLANAILLAYDRAPLSYRSVDENNYRETMLVFYELNSIMSWKKIFIEQNTFSANNYS